MSKIKHTPGPWSCKEYHVDNGNIWISTPIDYIGEVYPASIHHEITEEQAQANANLISAAPELLEALQIVQESGYLDGGYQPTIDLVNNAIKKALGK